MKSRRQPQLTFLMSLSGRYNCCCR